MLQRQKNMLPDKISKLFLKIKSKAFMKIFMYDTKSLNQSRKLRHYDLEIEGAGVIAACIQKKIQKTYLRTFYQIKNCERKPILRQHKRPDINSSKNINNVKKSSFRSQPSTDRQAITKAKSQYGKNLVNDYYTTRKNKLGSQYDQRQQLQTKSNLQALLQKVKQVNYQNKTNKQNKSYENLSYQNSRVESSKLSLHALNKLKNSRQINQPTFYTYQKPRNYVNTPNMTPLDRRSSHMNFDSPQYPPPDSNSMIRKWHRKQKRNIIMNKILQLQNSLYAQYEEQPQFEDNYFPVNYSQSYLHHQYQNHRYPSRSQMNVQIASNSRVFGKKY